MNEKPVDLMDALRLAFPRIWQHEHICHGGMNPPSPGPCAACERERAEYESGPPTKRHRYCGPCDAWVLGRECPRCGADTDKATAPDGGQDR